MKLKKILKNLFSAEFQKTNPRPAVYTTPYFLIVNSDSDYLDFHHWLSSLPQ